MIIAEILWYGIKPVVEVFLLCVLVILAIFFVAFPVLLVEAFDNPIHICWFGIHIFLLVIGMGISEVRRKRLRKERGLI